MSDEDIEKWIEDAREWREENTLPYKYWREKYPDKKLIVRNYDTPVEEYFGTHLEHLLMQPSSEAERQLEQDLTEIWFDTFYFPVEEWTVGDMLNDYADERELSCFKGEVYVMYWYA